MPRCICCMSAVFCVHCLGILVACVWQVHAHDTVMCCISVLCLGVFILNIRFWCSLHHCPDVCVCYLCAVFCALYVPTVCCIPCSEYLCLVVFTARCVYGLDTLLPVGCILCCVHHWLEAFVGYIRCHYSLHLERLRLYDIFMHYIQLYLLPCSSSGCHCLDVFIAYVLYFCFGLDARIVCILQYVLCTPLPRCQYW